MLAQHGEFAFEQVGTGRSFEKVIASLRGAIVRGDLAPGQRLPAEQDLARQMGVSRPLLREALKALELSGYLEVRRGYAGGRFVSIPEPEEFHTVKAAPLSTLDVSARHVMEVRLAIEPMAARLAADARDTTDLTHAFRQLALLAGPPARAVAAIVQFHGALVKSAGNPVLVAVFDSLRSPIAMRMSVQIEDASWCAICRDRLGELLELIDRSDSDEAEHATRRYLLEHEDEGIVGGGSR